MKILKSTFTEVKEESELFGDSNTFFLSVDLQVLAVIQTTSNMSHSVCRLTSRRLDRDFKRFAIMDLHFMRTKRYSNA